MIRSEDSITRVGGEALSLGEEQSGYNRYSTAVGGTDAFDVRNVVVVDVTIMWVVAVHFETGHFSLKEIARGIIRSGVIESDAGEMRDDMASLITVRAKLEMEYSVTSVIYFNLLV
eukprot:CAMPEP_0172489378 /NCGR_PEP_ID=MMETSP1066-20121228/19316_1 /TAXON_ID=671091 /ORGANISM="Coscinodiscus wailesii, Strain CCMP2513" /LENGTH=115 /DNA_ID=CAMNT_0013257173 /DNA_START=963 /DNA_END=1306 /DNA_ORIENTATION=-